MAKSIFIQRKVEKLFENYIEYNWMYNGRSGYSHLPKINEIRIFTNNENVIEEKVIGEYDIDSPPAHHRKTAYHIMNCKTGAFGVNNAWRRVSECLLFWHFHEKTE